MYDLVLSFLNQNTQPFAQVSGYHVHKPETSNHFMPIQLHILDISKYVYNVLKSFYKE